MVTKTIRGRGLGRKGDAFIAVTDFKFLSEKARNEATLVRLGYDASLQMKRRVDKKQLVCSYQKLARIWTSLTGGILRVINLVMYDSLATRRA